MMNKPAILVAMILLLITNVSYAQQEDGTQWQLKKESDGIAIFTRIVEDSKFKAVRSVMMTDFRLDSVIGLIRDNSACPRWADLCKESRTLEQKSETEAIVYNLNDIPWPVKDRDAITHVVWDRDASTGAVSMTATAIASDLVPPTSKAVRLKNAVTKWILTPKKDGLEIASEGHIDPSGPTPAWMTNLLLIDSPLKTMQKLRVEMANDRYADVEFDFTAE
ncbi:MAG: START domain-containing protein [Pseudomonadales bacterium]